MYLNSSQYCMLKIIMGQYMCHQIAQTCTITNISLCLGNSAHFILEKRLSCYACSIQADLMNCSSTIKQFYENQIRRPKSLLGTINETSAILK